MRDDAWAAGMADLGFARLSGGPQGKADAERTSQLYRRHLDGLSEDAWAFAVDQVVDFETWWPPVAKLREYAESYRPPARGHIAPSMLSPEDRESMREECRAESRRGLEQIKAALAERGIEVGEPVRSMPEPEG